MLKAAIIGATGIAGQQFITALNHHPFITVARVGASPRSAGKAYHDAICDAQGARQWFSSDPLPDWAASMRVEEVATMLPHDIDLVFSALESDAARDLEPRFAQHCPVVSTASAFRYEKDVPILIPGINNDHLALARRMQHERGWKGFILPNPNCTVTGLAITLAPLYRRFGVEQVIMTSLQAVSGSGRSAGTIALDIIDNVIPYIPKEEEKVARETGKILGRLSDDGIIPAAFPVSCTCTRVPVLEGHTESVSVGLSRAVTFEEVRAAWQEFGQDLQDDRYPSSPKKLITLQTDPFRPQPRFDRDNDGGMTTTVGRLRECKALRHGISYVLVSHNTRMGAAKGAVLMAEIAIAQGLIGGR